MWWRELPKSLPLIGFCGAPWTVATYMVEGGGSKDQAAARLFAYRDQATFRRLIDLLVESSADYLLNQVKAGASALQIFDSWAGSLPEDEFERWCIAPTKRLVARVKASFPGIPIIGFPRGSGVLAERYAQRDRHRRHRLRHEPCRSAGCGALQEHLPVQGNLDPLLLVAGGEALGRARRRDPRDPWAATLHLQSRPRHPARDADRACRAACRSGEKRLGGMRTTLVMAGLVPAIHDFDFRRIGMPGTSAGHDGKLDLWKLDAARLRQGLPRHRDHRLDGGPALSAAAVRLSRDAARPAPSSPRPSR